MPRILSLDYGIKRTGIAVTDEMQIIASGLTTVSSNELILFLKDYFSKEKVEKVIIGEPKQMNGMPSESAPLIEKFIKEFKKEFREKPGWEKGTPKRVNNLTKFKNDVAKYKRAQNSSNYYSSHYLIINGNFFCFKCINFFVNSKRIKEHNFYLNIKIS